MSKTEFVYTTYIKSTPQKVWDAITTREFARQYWRMELVSDWKIGSSWEGINEGNEAAHLNGKILESAPPHRLVISWYDPADIANISEHSRVIFEIDMIGDMVRLNVIHNDLTMGSSMAVGVSAGWPRVLSSLKSFLETGTGLDVWAGGLGNCGSAEKKTASR